MYIPAGVCVIETPFKAIAEHYRSYLQNTKRVPVLIVPYGSTCACTRKRLNEKIESAL